MQLPVGNLDTKDWLKYSTAKIAAGEIDRLVEAELAKLGVKPAAKTTDEQFIRRVYLDLTGKLPVPADVKEFSEDKSADKRAKLIDNLLDSDDYAKHWGQYWRSVITTRATLDFRLTQVTPAFERWLTEQFKANKSWATITRELITAKGKVMYDEPNKNAQAFFLLTRRGADATTEIAAETSRIFLGIQIQCAQCHDHPSDVWKRQAISRIRRLLRSLQGGTPHPRGEEVCRRRVGLRAVRRVQDARQGQSQDRNDDDPALPRRQSPQGRRGRRADHQQRAAEGIRQGLSQGRFWWRWWRRHGG